MREVEVKVKSIKKPEPAITTSHVEYFHFYDFDMAELRSVLYRLNILAKYKY